VSSAPATRSPFLERVMKLRPKSYAYRPDVEDEAGPLPAGDQYGFIAQEVERLFPALVERTTVRMAKRRGRASRSRTIKAVRYTGFIAILVAAVQEQQRTIDELRAASTRASPKR
jgi:hypothetical protein